MAVKLAVILFAAVVVSTSFLEEKQISKQEAKNLEYYSNPSQRDGIQERSDEDCENNIQTKWCKKRQDRCARNKVQSRCFVTCGLCHKIPTTTPTITTLSTLTSTPSTTLTSTPEITSPKPPVVMTTPIECKGKPGLRGGVCQKDGCEVGDTSKGFTTYSFMIRNASQFEVRECFTVYRPLSRSNQALPVVGTVQKLASNGLSMAEFKNPKDAINRAAEKYGFARILLSTCNSKSEIRNCTVRTRWNGEMLNYGKALIDWILSKPSEFDASKIYLEGFSTNGKAANKIGTYLHQKIAGLFMPGGDSCFAEEKPMVRCMTPHKGDRMDMGGMPNNITNKLEISWNKHLIEGNDPRLFIFAGNEHKQIENRWDWMVGCFGINPPCSKSCEQTLFDCMDSSTAEIGIISGVKEGTKEFSECMFSLESPCSECAPTLEMLKRSEFPEVERFNNFGAPIPPTEHKRSNESKCVWEKVWD